MSLLVNDISWGQVSLCNFVNSWAPGVFSFLVGIIFNRITVRRSLRKNLKNRLLEIFIPTFNTGRTITGEEAVRVHENLKATLNTYLQVYPKIFNRKKTDELQQVLGSEFVKDGQVNDHIFDPRVMIDVIQGL